MSAAPHAAPITTPGSDRPVESLPAAEPTRQPAGPSRPPAEREPAPAPPVAFAPRGRIRASTQQATPSVSSLLDMVAYAPWSKNLNLSISTYVPDASNMFYFLHCCDTLMLSTDRYVRGHPHWLPFISRVYIGMLYYFRIMDCMVLSGQAQDIIISLLHQIKNAFDFRQLMIPGPLVPHFQSLSVCSSGSELIGDVSPTLPDLQYAGGTTHYTLAYRATICPNILSLMDIPQRLASSQDDPIADANLYDAVPHIIANLFSVDIPDANDNDLRNAISGPGFKSSSNLTGAAIRNFWQTRLRLALPPRIPQAASTRNNVVTWKQFLRFTPVPGEPAHPNFSLWFGNVAQLMADYSAFFKGSTSLGSIPIASGAAPHVLIQYSAPAERVNARTRPDYVAAVTGPPVAPAFYRLVTMDTLQCTATIRAPSVPELHKQLGTLTQTNARTAGTDQADRTGAAWDQSPIQEEMSSYDIIGNVPTYVASLHLSRALE